MLIPGDLVVLLPTMTRYEQPGGGTSTSTERRIRFSPEIPGPRVAEAKPEWEVPALVARRVDPSLERVLPWRHPSEIRAEIGRLVPLYEGIGDLDREGRSVQWGGERLFEGGRFRKMEGERLRLRAEDPPRIRIPEGKFHLATRRGKQFNSMIHAKRDPLTGAGRDAVFMNGDDMRALSIPEGGRVRLVSSTGTLVGRVTEAPVRLRTLQVHWPEGNVLIPRRCDPVSGEPDYNVFVDVEPMSV